MLKKNMNVVTQEELLRLKSLETEHWTLRNDIRNRILDGGPVEPGRVCVSVKTNRHRKATHSALWTLFGQKAEYVINALPRITIHNVSIHVGDANLTEDQPRPVFDPSNTVKSGTPDESPEMSLDDLLVLLLKEPPESEDFGGEYEFDGKLYPSPQNELQGSENRFIDK